MRLLVWCLNAVVLIVLAVFAKDNLVNEVKHWLSSPSTTHAPAEVKNQGSIEVIFSPNQGATAAIVKAVSEARSSIMVSAYSFTSKDIAKALLDAKKRNVQVRIILDKSQVTQKYSSTTFFANLGFDLRIDVRHAIFHNKVMIIDEKTIITGSFNFTKAAETKNAENVLILRNNPALARAYMRDWAEHWHQAISLSEYVARRK